MAAGRIDSIQALRFVAALAVVTHHISLFANGAWGVDLFFVISGYIMCLVTERSPRDFLARRIIRVVPLYWAGTLAVFALALAAPSLVRNTQPDLGDLARSLAFIPFRKGIAVEPVLFLGWSLNYEMFFYALFALAMAASHRHRALICSALLAAIVVLGLVARPQSVAFAFYSAPVILEFALGMACWSLLPRPGTAPPRSRWPWLAAGALLLAWMPLANILVVHVPQLIRHGVPAAAVFVCAVRGLDGLALPRWLVEGGDASYSLYLFHPYVIYAWERVLHAFTRDARGYAMAVLAMALCWLLSIALYRGVERPLTQWLRGRLARHSQPGEA